MTRMTPRSTATPCWRGPASPASAQPASNAGFRPATGCAARRSRARGRGGRPPPPGRVGLLRSREVLMKDAYWFDGDVEGLKASYKLMYDAYHRVFERCGLSFRPVEDQAGEIGGDVNHEFMAVAAVGEDDFVWCRNCDYAANVEAALRGAAPGASADST